MPFGARQHVKIWKTGQLPCHYIHVCSWNIDECDVKPQPTNLSTHRFTWISATGARCQRETLTPSGRLAPPWYCGGIISQWFFLQPRIRIRGHPSLVSMCNVFATDGLYVTKTLCIYNLDHNLQTIRDADFTFILYWWNPFNWHLGNSYVTFLKGHRHDWGQCLFTKIIWHEILIEFLQKVIQKCTNHFGKDWAINRAEITHKSLYL